VEAHIDAAPDTELVLESLLVYRRNPRQALPRAFDYSPYFDIIKYPLFGLDDLALSSPVLAGHGRRLQRAQRLLPGRGRGSRQSAYKRPMGPQLNQLQPLSPQGERA